MRLDGVSRDELPCGCYTESSASFFRLHWCAEHAEAIGRETGVRPRDVAPEAAWVEQFCKHLEAQMGGTR